MNILFFITLAMFLVFMVIFLKTRKTNAEEENFMLKISMVVLIFCTYLSFFPCVFPAS